MAWLEYYNLHSLIRKTAQKVQTFFERAVEIIQRVGKFVIEVAVVSAKLVGVLFGVPFDHSYHDDFRFSRFVGLKYSNKPPQISSLGTGFSLAKTGSDYSIECVQCGFQGHFSVDGRLACNLQNGLTEGSIALTSKEDFVISAIVGITTNGKYAKTIYEKQLASVPLSPLTIPGVITLGPEITLNTDIVFSIDGSAELLIGGTLSISPGKAKLSIKNRADNGIDGFKAKFKPVAEFNGTISATLELGFPMAFEVGVNVLNGKFKKTVGLVNKPSIYTSAVATNKADSACQNGVELLLGVKNIIYFTALDLWNYDLRTDILYEKSIACVTSIYFCLEKLATDIAKKKPVASNLVANQKPQTRPEGYRLIMDGAKTSILVAGTDGYIYLVDTKENYDETAPWGTVNLKDGAVNMDVLGRLMGYKFIAPYKSGAEVRLWDPAKTPLKTKAVSLKILKSSDKDYQAYGLTLGLQGDKYLTYYTTFCKTDQGLRLFASRYLVNENHVAVKNSKRDSETAHELTAPKCETIKLTSSLKK
ncbi:hypothetical protein GQ53DRAFT_864074 [Thozetella sp. PMI_491]|nr:hypothetical protein GQ53DRAFT_864074 [Thozetella sp. PMI_491]